MYFAKITNSYNAKNRLQDYLSKQLKSLDCLTVEDPEAFKKYLDTTVHKANLKFPRCRPLVSYLHTTYSSGGFSAGVSDLIQFSLYKQCGVFESTQTIALVHQNELVQASLFS